MFRESHHEIRGFDFSFFTIWVPYLLLAWKFLWKNLNLNLKGFESAPTNKNFAMVNHAESYRILLLLLRNSNLEVGFKNTYNWNNQHPKNYRQTFHQINIIKSIAELLATSKYSNTTRNYPHSYNNTVN